MKKSNFIQHFFWIVLLFPVHSLVSQADSIILDNGQYLVGEIKNMTRSVLTIETAFSKNDFTIKWKEISEIYTTTHFLITLKDGRWINSAIQTISPKLARLESEDSIIETALEEVVYLKELKTGVWSRLDANVDVGLNLTKANNLQQLNFSTRLGYLTEHSAIQVYFQAYRSAQDSVATTIRNEGGIDYRYFLPDDWYVLPQLEYLSNTEQALKSRISPNLGAGRFLARDNRLYWGVFGGISYNKEVFTNDTPERSSAELYAGTEFNLFDFGDLDLLTNVVAYPSLTQQGRWRTDFKFDSKYEFVEDFYIRLNLTLNYDNQPAIMGNETDYVFGISIGWEK